MFLTGFVFGSVVTYLVCLEQQLLPWEGKLELAGVAALFGVVVGLITMLVHQLGLFITGFSNGALLGTGALVIMEFFYHPRTVWICIGVVFLTGLVSALLILYFQKGLTILSTGMCGAALLTVAIDYYVEKFAMVYYVYDCVRNSQDVQLGQMCWFTWVILGIWPALFVIGILTQWNITGKGVDHKEGKCYIICRCIICIMNIGINSFQFSHFRIFPAIIGKSFNFSILFPVYDWHLSTTIIKLHLGT